jgi:hypothetical protein
MMEKKLQIRHSITQYTYQISGAEIVILCIIQDVEKFEGTSVDISRNKATDNQDDLDMTLKEN